jgi:hypothetical protein
MTQLSRMGIAALALAQEYGLAVFPLHAPSAGGCSCGKGGCERTGKHPRTVDGFKGATTHPAQIAEWWDRWPEANIGVTPGASQLIVLDIDGPAGEETARALGVFAAPTLETITARGVHRWFRLPPAVRLTNHSPWAELDVRAHAGYVLAPPSVHASGVVYDWRGSFDDVADVPPAVLEALLPPERAPALPAALPRASMRAPDDLAERRVLAYVAKLGEGLSDGRKTAAFRLAAFLVHDVQLSESASWRMLVVWNRHNAPPLRESVLNEIHGNARQYGGRRGSSAA